MSLIRSCALPHRIPSPTLTCAPMLHAHLHQRLGSRNAVEVPFSFSPASGRLMLRGASSWRHVNIGSGTLMLWDHGAAIADRSGGQRHGSIAVAWARKSSTQSDSARQCFFAIRDTDAGA